MIDDVKAKKIKESIERVEQILKELHETPASAEKSQPKQYPPLRLVASNGKGVN